MDPATPRTRLVLAPAPESGSRARSAVRRLCLAAGVDLDTLETAVLLAHELVANAVEHASGEPVLEAVVAGETLRVAVTDTSARLPLPVPLSDELTERGRGLMLVAALARRWGAETRPDGKTVWCEIEIEVDEDSAVA